MSVGEIKRTSEQTLHMFRRVASRRRGQKESDTLSSSKPLWRPVSAFIDTIIFVPYRITYVTPYLLLNTGDTQVLNVIIRKAVPMSASTSKLLEIVLYNTVDQLILRPISPNTSKG